MFYLEEMNPNMLRQGDIISGYIRTSIYIKNPIMNENLQDYKYELKSEIPQYSGIVSQCCDIENETAQLAPLRKINKKMFQNPELIKNPIKLNEKIEKIDLLHPTTVKYLKENKKENYENIIQDGKKYQFNSFFFYQSSETFPEYSIEFEQTEETINTRAYYIDFREIYQINCKQIQRKNFGKDILGSKVLELTIEGRNQLRQKLNNFFCRIPEEDEI
jgi:hypothetical protein